ncbi:DUF6193 family natural product biosynthesis protein [Embleya sp. NPDC059259]|uniref:DUF6193 family natural product biosynthesis protein n=1 Tax=unclassified Embleya TaxID=2699296 RepID=UPI0036752C48
MAGLAGAPGPVPARNTADPIIRERKTNETPVDLRIHPVTESGFGARAFPLPTAAEPASRFARRYGTLGTHDSLYRLEWSASSATFESRRPAARTTRVADLLRVVVQHHNGIVSSDRFSYAEGVPVPPRPALPDLAAAHERGPAAAVEVKWQQLILSWQWMRERHEILRPMRPYPGIVPLLEAAFAQPGLRQLFPFTSHHTLCFSSCTGYPYVLRVPCVDPHSDGRFRVRRPRSSIVIGYTDTAKEAVALVTANFPAGLGPAGARADGFG